MGLMRLRPTHSETSRAYTETVTLTLVSARSVGIGAYLVRLGHRVVQVETSHIILTGANALNKVLIMASLMFSSAQRLIKRDVTERRNVHYSLLPFARRALSSSACNAYARVHYLLSYQVGVDQAHPSPS